MFSRNGSDRAGFNIQFHPDQRFRGVHDVVTIDRANEQEVVVKHMINKAGVMGGMYDDVVNVASPSGQGDGPTNLQMARHGDVYLDSQFENGSQGTVYKFEGIRVMTNTVDNRPESLKIYQPIGWVSNFDITDLGDDKELYRWPFLITNNRAKDDFSGMIALAKAFSLEGQELQEAVAEVMDVDEWMRHLCHDVAGRDRRCLQPREPAQPELLPGPEDNKMLVFPWDWDFTFSNSYNSALYGGRNFSIGKVISLPVYERLYMGHMLDIMQTTFNTDYMTEWLAHYGTMLRTSFTANANYIRQRSEFVKGRLPDEVPFAITSGSDVPVTTTRSSMGIEGVGWINVREVRLAGQSEPLPIVWIDTDRWQVELALNPGANTFALEAYDAQGALVRADQIVVTRDVTSPVGEVLVSEVHYHNVQAPRIGASGPEDFEFVELYNKSRRRSIYRSGGSRGPWTMSFPRARPSARGKP